MKKETILKLLQSSSYDDVILGLNYMKDYTWEEILTMGEYGEKFQNVRVNTNATGTLFFDDYILSFGIYCHFNSSLFFYNDRPHPSLYSNYKQL